MRLADDLRENEGGKEVQDEFFVSGSGNLSFAKKRKGQFWGKKDNQLCCMLTLMYLWDIQKEISGASLN